MKKLLLILFLMGGSIGVFAQRVNQCGIIIPSTYLRNDFASVYEAKSYVNRMLDHADWEENFQLREQNGINNAYATIIRNQRYIVYDNNFLERLDGYAGTKWASISVLAHEMGHHYYNHMFGVTGSTPPKELEADFFSGYMMAKMGAGLEEAKAAMSKIASPSASSSHPAKSDRLNAITRGWNDAMKVSGQPTGNTTSGNRNSGNRYPGNTNSGSNVPDHQHEQSGGHNENDGSWIHLSQYSNADMTVYLSDDGRKFTAAQIKTSQPFVFKYEVYDYGWLRFGYGKNIRTYKLYHGKDYAIVRNRRTNAWSVIEVQ